MSKLNIGITACLPNTEKAKGILWSNGCRQTVFYLYKLISNTKHNAFLVGEPHKESDDGFYGIKIHKLNDLKDDLNILIMLGTTIFEEDARYLDNVGCKLIGFQSGNDYIFTVEKILFKPPIITNSVREPYHLYEEIWTIPQHINTCFHFTKTLLRKPLIPFPHIWNPFLLDEAKEVVEKKTNHKANYSNTGKKEKRITLFEPNINVVKTALIPLLIVEKMYGKRPELLERVCMTNAIHIKDKLQFTEFSSQLDIMKNDKVYFAARYPIVEWLSRYTDICVIHQWENAMNNMYLDALYLDYPLVHNSHFWKDYGYYYPDFNIEKGSEALLEAIETHDDNLEAYKKKSAELLWAHHTDNPRNIGFFEGLVKRFESDKH